MPTHLALLRGVNVGGKNIIRMTELKACFEKLGFADVATFIQSGNVLFTAREKNTGRIVETIEKGIAERFGGDVKAHVVTARDMRAVVAGAPRGFGKQPEKFRYNVIFLFRTLTPAAALKAVNPRPGVDTVRAGKGVLYFCYPMARATQSRISKVIMTPEYKRMTIRNWNSTSKLAELMDLVTCSRGHRFQKSAARPTCPTCWPGRYRKGGKTAP